MNDHGNKFSFPDWMPLIHSILPPVISVGTLILLNLIYHVPFSENYQVLAVFSFIVALFVFRESNRDSTLHDLDYLVQLRRAFGPWLLIISLLAVVGYGLKISAVFSRRVLLTWMVISPFAIAFAQFALHRSLAEAWRGSARGRKTVIAGANDYSQRLGDALNRHARFGMRLLGYFDDRNPGRLGSLKPSSILGRLDDLSKFVRENNVEVVYIAMPIRHEERMKQVLEELHDTTASLYFVPDIFVFDLIQAQVDMIDGIPVLALRESPHLGINSIIKRVSDLIISSLLLILAAPAMVAIALAIKLTTPGSIIFKQRRYGLDGREIIVYKFRTMIASDDDGQIPQATADDPRVTPLGRFLRRYSLDELPQLLNVLEGRMSMVGPRPHAVAHNEMYRKLIRGYMLRHKVTPGITGLAQINGCRGETKSICAMEARVAYDLEYLRCWSVWLDMKILLKTMLQVIHDSRAY